MSGTMSIAISDELRAYVAERIAGGEYGNTSEYVRDLIRRDRREQEAERIRALVAEGLASGDPVPFTEERAEELRARVLGPRV